MTFTVHSPETAPAGSREPMDRLTARVGFLPNLAATIACAPAAMVSFDAQQGALRGTALTGAEREVVGVTVSLANTCAYSVAAHSVFAEANGLPADVLAALRAGRELPDARLEALRAFTVALLEHRGHLRPDGLDEATALEVIAQAAYTTMANWAANVGGAPVDAAFARMAWSEPAAATG